MAFCESSGQCPSTRRVLVVARRRVGGVDQTRETTGFPKGRRGRFAYSGCAAATELALVLALACTLGLTGETRWGSRSLALARPGACRSDPLFNRKPLGILRRRGGNEEPNPASRYQRLTKRLSTAETPRAVGWSLAPGAKGRPPPDSACISRPHTVWLWAGA